MTDKPKLSGILYDRAMSEAARNKLINEAMNKKYGDRWTDKTTRESAGFKCPYCGYLETDVSEYFNGFEEDGQEVNCQDCEKPFWLSRSIIITYYGAPAVEDQEQMK